MKALAFQEQRIHRAEEVAATYTFRDLGNLVLVTSPEGKTYRVNKVERTCTCPDFVYRCRDIGILCKHLVAVMQRGGVVTRDPEVALDYMSACAAEVQRKQRVAKA